MFTNIQIALLQGMYHDNIIGGRHHGERELCRGLPNEYKANTERELKGLIKLGWVLVKSTNYGKQYSLNPKALNEIREIIELE